MEFLKELWALPILDEAAKPLKKAAKSVYHRDYEKTKKKAYRKYDPAEYAAGKHKGESE